MKSLILLATFCVASALLPASSDAVADTENKIDNIAIQSENIDKVADTENEIEELPTQDEKVNTDADTENKIDNIAIQDENIDKVADTENVIDKLPTQDETIDPVADTENKIDNMATQDENIDTASQDETNDPDLMMTDEGELENQKRAVRRSVLIGGCNFNVGYRRCPRINVHNWMEQHGSGCNDVNSYCPHLKRFGFCNRRSGFYTVMRRKCRRTCQICTDPCRDITHAGRCNVLKSWGFCRRNNPFYGTMRRQCKKTCRQCTPHKRHLMTKIRNASVRFYTYKTWLRKIPAVRNCKCNPRTGVCGKLNFCVSFRYALNNVRTNRLTNTLRVYSYSYNTYVVNRRRRGRHSFTTPRNIYIPSGRRGDRNRWKLMRANLQLECGSRFYFHVFTGPRQNQLVKLDDFYVRVGRC